MPIYQIDDYTLLQIKENKLIPTLNRTSTIYTERERERERERDRQTDRQTDR